MNVTLIDNCDSLYALAGEWPEVSGGVPFRSLEWLGAWWKAFAADQPSAELMTLAVRDDDGTLIAVAPWYVSRSLASGRAVRFLGTGMVCSDYLTVNCRSGREFEAAGALAAWLSAECQRWDLIELSSFSATDILVPELGRQLAAEGYGLHSSPALSCWRLNLAFSWDEHVATLSKSHRQRIIRLVRRWYDTKQAVAHVIDNVEQWPAAYNMLRELHQLRRTSLGERGCFAVPEFDEFLNTAGQAMVQSGRAFLVVLEVDGKPAAAEFNLVGDDTIYFYQTGLDPDCLHAEPGHLLSIARIRRAIDAGYRHVDFLRGDQPYKSFWDAKPLPMCDLRIVRRRPAAVLRHQVWIANRSARRLARHGLNIADDVRRRVRTLRADILKAVRVALAPAQTATVATE